MNAVNASRWVLIVLALALIQATGCIGPAAGMGDITFSADSSRVCYFSYSNIVEWVVDGKTWMSSIALNWCSTSGPTSVSSTHIETRCLEWMSHGTGPTGIQWSHDGSRIGLLASDKLVIVDANSGKKSIIRDGRITSFAWQSDVQVAYCTDRTEKRGQRRFVCSENVNTFGRNEIYAFPPRRFEEFGRQGQWSPSGKSVIIMEPDYGGRYHCVNTADGTALAFGRTDSYREGVAWAPDASRVLCLSGKVGPENDFEAILLNPVRGAIVDCTQEFRRTFGPRAPRLEPLWTADGKYVIANSTDHGGYLVQPDPWQAIPLGKMLTLPETPQHRPWLFRLPVPGWVAFHELRPQGDWVRHVLSIADYSGRRVMPFPAGDLSPDGTMAAKIGEDRHILIRRLGNWWQNLEATTQSQPATK